MLVENAGDADLIINDITFSNAGDCSPSVNGSVALGLVSGTSHLYTISIDGTTNDSTFLFRMEIANNDPNEDPYTIDVSGQRHDIANPNTNACGCAPPGAGAALDTWGLVWLMGLVVLCAVRQRLQR
ncbi:MAG: hypothetical protein AB7S36_13100 [Planctomycetota bacterium]